MNKKILIPAFATAMGLALIGGVGGSVAWYQYNTKVSASYVGASVAESGLLEIGTKASANADIDWSKKDIWGSTESDAGTLKAVTFGETEKDAALPEKAYYHPEAGVADMTKWKEATANHEYLQYEFYLKAEQFDNAQNSMQQVVKKVYLSDLTIEIKETAKAKMLKAVRVHIDVDGGSKFLVSKDAVSDLEMYGNLDLDQEDGNDIVGGYSWIEGRDNFIMYGYPDAGTQGNEKYQNTYGVSEVKSERVNGAYGTNDQVICTTPATGAQKVTVTIWLEGWQPLTTSSGANASASAIWEPAYGDDATVHVGMTFDVGRDAFEA